MRNIIEVTAAIFFFESNIMAIKCSQGQDLTGFWGFPCGKIKPGESPEQSLKRVLKEEFKIYSEIGEFVAESIFNFRGKHVCLSAYRVKSWSGDFQQIGHDEIRWLAIDELDILQWSSECLPIIEALKQQAKSQSTAEFYSSNAKAYYDDTLTNDVNKVRDRFLSTLPSATSNKQYILDLGCGAGRDSKVFIDAGFTVTALEASKDLALLAEGHIGQPVLNMRYQQLQVKNTYDGIWACASLLHCPKSQIEYVMQNCIDALKEGGVFYFSFKYGKGERLDDWGRFFNDYTLESIKALIAKFHELEIIELKKDITLLRGKKQAWVSGLVRKVGEPKRVIQKDRNQ